MDHKHDDGGCNCRSANRDVHQTIDEMEFERGIWTAAIDNDLRKLEKFIAAGKVNAQDNFGYTALHYAARAGHLEACQLLLRGGIHVDTATRSGGVTALQRAAMCGRLAVVRLLVEGVGGGGDGRAQIKLRDVDGKTALHRAVEGRHRDVVEYLMGRDVTLADVEDNHGQTPREVARQRGYLEILDLFNLFEKKIEGDGQGQ